MGKKIIRLLAMLVLTAMTAMVAIAMYNDMNIDLSKSAKHTGRVNDVKVVEKESENIGNNLEFLHLRMEGVPKPLSYRKVFGSYDDLRTALAGNPMVTIYYDYETNDPEFAIYQLEINEKVLISKDEFENKSLWGLLIVGSFVVFAIIYIPFWIRRNFFAKM